MPGQRGAACKRSTGTDTGTGTSCMCLHGSDVRGAARLQQLPDMPSRAALRA